MTETTASSRVTQENGTRPGNGAEGAAWSPSNHAGNVPGGARYTDADIEPIRARLSAFARGDYRRLMVDDDARSVFALTGLFERCGAEVLHADNGRAGIESLERNENISLVLMDVMMPELDGNATMRAIRKMPQSADLPIIALTAKAMKGDREKSIQAGASDYFPKPVETDHLLQLMRHWLRRGGGPGGLGVVGDSP